METKEKTNITVEVNVHAPAERVWSCFNEPEHVIRWNYASDDWQSPFAENDLVEGGRFNYRMEAKDGSMGFDFTGTYDKVEPYELVEFTLDDNRRVKVTFEREDDQTKVVETFEAEHSNSLEMQKQGWQAILNNFKKYVEGLGRFEKMHIEILIDADVEKVYRTMLGQQTYSEWTAEFNPASRYEGSWAKGSSIRFIGEDQEGNKGGMISRIRENIPNRYVSIEHLGVLKGDTEVTSGPEVEKWAGGLEDYTFDAKDGKTMVLVDVDITDEFKDYFADTWPKALNKLKELCETR